MLGPSKGCDKYARGIITFQCIGPVYLRSLFLSKPLRPGSNNSRLGLRTAARLQAISSRWEAAILYRRPRSPSPLTTQHETNPILRLRQRAASSHFKIWIPVNTDSAPLAAATSVWNMVPGHPTGPAFRLH